MYSIKGSKVGHIILPTNKYGSLEGDFFKACVMYQTALWMQQYAEWSRSGPLEAHVLTSMCITFSDESKGGC